MRHPKTLKEGSPEKGEKKRGKRRKNEIGHHFHTSIPNNPCTESPIE